MKSSANLVLFGVDETRRLHLRGAPEGLSVEMEDLRPGEPIDARVLVLNERQLDKNR